MFKTVNVGDMIKTNYRIIITFCFSKAPVWKRNVPWLEMFVFSANSLLCTSKCFLRRAFSFTILSCVTVFWTASYFL